MTSTISKWGNSMGIRIPREVLKRAHLSEGVVVEYEFQDGNILIKPVRKRSELQLDDLVGRITIQNRPDRNSLSPIGREVW